MLCRCGTRAVQVIAQVLYSCCACGVLSGRVTQIKSHAWDNTTVVLVGNKSDLKNGRRVDREQGAMLAEELGRSGGGK